MDNQGQIIAATVTESHEQDPSQVPALLFQVDQTIERFIGDGIYDQQPVYAAVERHAPSVRVIIPPRKDAVLSPKGASSPTQRDQHILEIERDGRFDWKRTSGYYDQAYAENVFSRFKRTFGDRLRAKRDAAQEREASLACVLLNRMRELGSAAIISCRLLLDLCNNAFMKVNQSSISESPLRVARSVTDP